VHRAPAGAAIYPTERRIQAENGAILRRKSSAPCLPFFLQFLWVLRRYLAPKNGAFSVYAALGKFETALFLKSGRKICQRLRNLPVAILL
jgi:hypothetical protein